MTYLGTRPPTVDEWEKYELEEFIVNEFADSLNGYDDFISEEKTDKYTKVIRDLQILKTRLNLYSYKQL